MQTNGIKHSPAIGEFAVAEVERLRAENAELRAALEEISRVCAGPDMTFTRIYEVARAALAKAKT